MQMIYNSPNYCVVEFAPQAGHLAMVAGGYEIVDKNTHLSKKNRVSTKSTSSSANSTA
jgi:hypothetical protein